MFDLLSKPKSRLLEALLASDLAKQLEADAELDRAKQRRELLRQLAAAHERHGRESAASAAKLKSIEAKLVAVAQTFRELQCAYGLALGADLGLSHGHMGEQTRLERALADLVPDRLRDLFAAINSALHSARTTEPMRLTAVARAAEALIFEPDESKLLTAVAALEAELAAYRAEPAR